MSCGVSIIIPVYNCERFLDRCVSSVLSQTDKNFELILVDDGSTDASAEIIKKYVATSEAVGVFQENGGPSAARNAGIKRATKDYIMFIDSDDYIDCDYVEQYVTAIENTDLDIVMGGFKKVTGEHVDFVRSLDGGEFSKYVVGGPVAKIYRRQFLEVNNIAFPRIAESEDVYFNAQAIKHGAKIGYIKNTGYYYYFNPKSLSNTLHKGFSKKVNILSLMESINFDDIQNKELHQYYIVRYIIWYLLYSGKGATKKAFIEEYRKYFIWIENNIHNYKKNKNIKPLGPKGEQKSIGITVYIFMLLHKLHLVKLFAAVYCKG